MAKISVIIKLMTEKRKFPRLSLDIEVNFLNKAYAEFVDISTGGLCIVVDKHYKIDSILNLSLHFPEKSSRITAFCKVRWVKEVSDNYHKIGLEYWKLSETDNTYIKTYIGKALEAEGK